ncbi:MAG: flagellar protein FliT [Thiobacillus sp.]
MTSHEMLATYESLSELTGTMLAAARGGDWDRLVALEARCQGYVGSLMQAEPMQLSAAEMRAKVAIIRTILQHDAQIRALTEPRMHELQQNLAMMRTTRHGLDAYGAQRA